jgi:hypothetical protein
MAWIAKTITEQVYTRDAKIPLRAGDDDFNFGWECIPVPPTVDDGWKIFDDRPDYKTGWQRKIVCLFWIGALQ